MEATRSSTGNIIGIIKALVIVLIGIVIAALTWWTIIGAVIGVLLIIVGLFTGGKSKIGWQCNSCGAFVEKGTKWWLPN